MAGPRRPHHRFGEHTGEVALTIRADALGALFEEAARALAGLLAEDATGPPTMPEARIRLSAPDDAALLVDWLNELVARGEIDKCVFADVKVERIGEGSLEAVVRGRHPRSPRTAVKAATWHDLRMGPDGDGFAAHVVLDV